MKHKLALGLKVAVAVGLISYLALTEDLSEFDPSRFSRFETWQWLLGGHLFVFFLLLFTALRWHVLLRGQAINQRFSQTFIVGTIGFFFNQCIPGTTGGDLVKAYYIAVGQPQKRTAGVTTIILDRLIGLVVILLIGGAAILSNRDQIQSNPDLRYLGYLPTAVLAVLLGVAIASLLFFSARFRSQPWVSFIFRKVPFRGVLNSAQAAVYAYKSQPGTLLLAALFSVLTQSSVILSNLCFFFALGGAEIAWQNFLFLVPLAHLFMAIPISIGGLGVGETAYRVFFREVGYAHGASLAVLQRISWYLWAVLGLIFYLRRKKTVDQAIALGEAQEARLDGPTGSTNANGLSQTSGGSEQQRIEVSETVACHGFQVEESEDDKP